MELSDNDEQLVADFVGEFAERFRDGADVDPKDYLDRLPTKEMKEAFLEAANVSRLVSVMEQVRQDDGSARRKARRMNARA
jgi:hypothetical protein